MDIEFLEAALLLHTDDDGNEVGSGYVGPGVIFTPHESVKNLLVYAPTHNQGPPQRLRVKLTTGPGETLDALLDDGLPEQVPEQAVRAIANAGRLFLKRRPS